MPSKFAYITLVLPLCYLAIPIVYLLAISPSNPRAVEYLHVGLVLAIPVLTAISALAMVLNRAPVFYSAVQGALAVLACIAMPVVLDFFSCEHGQLHKLMWGIIFSVIIVSPVIGTIAGVTMTRRASQGNYQFPSPHHEPPAGSPP